MFKTRGGFRGGGGGGLADASPQVFDPLTDPKGPPLYHFEISIFGDGA